MVKFIVLGDLHLRNQNPINRKDNIFEAQMNKLNQTAEFAKENGIKYIMQVGDFFDSYSPSKEVLNRTVGWLFDKQVDQGLNFVLVYGQHDLYMRSYRSVERTALDLLYKAGLVEIVGKEPLVLEKEVVVYGMSFGEEIPKVCLEYANLFSILLSHEPILTPKQLQKDEVFCSTVRKINREKGKIFDLFINGDWHYPYCNSRCEGGLAVLNPGAVTRLSLGDRERLKNSEGKIMRPGFELVIIDKKEIKFERIPFDCSDWEEIFVEREIIGLEKTNIRDWSFKDFLDELKKGSFYDNVMKWMDTEKNEEVKEIVMEALKYAKEKGN